MHPKTHNDCLRYHRGKTSHLMHRKRIACCGVFVSAAMLATAVPVGARAADHAYCVRSVNVVAADVTADLERKLRSLEPLPATPDFFNLSIGARYPLAWHAHTVEGRDRLKDNHSLYWSFSENYELVGPRDFLGAGYPVTVGRDGRSFFSSCAVANTAA